MLEESIFKARNMLDKCYFS